MMRAVERARNWGDQLQGARECKTMREANGHSLTAISRNVRGASVYGSMPGDSDADSRGHLG